MATMQAQVMSKNFLIVPDVILIVSVLVISCFYSVEKTPQKYIKYLYLFALQTYLSYIIKYLSAKDGLQGQKISAQGSALRIVITRCSARPERA